MGQHAENYGPNANSDVWPAKEFLNRTKSLESKEICLWLPRS